MLVQTLSCIVLQVENNLGTTHYWTIDCPQKEKLITK